jgi:hypothetical protein
MCESPKCFDFVSVSQEFQFLCLCFPSVPTLCVSPKCSDFSIFLPSVRLLCVCLLSFPTSMYVLPSVPNSMFEQRCKQPTKCNNFQKFILLKSALHVSADVFVHFQEKFNCIYSFGTRHRPAADRGHSWDGTEFHLNRVTGRQQVGAVYQSCIYS